MFVKLIKGSLFVLAALILLLAVGVGVLYFSSGVQKRLFVSLVEREPGVSVQVETVRYRGGRAVVRDLFILRGTQGMSLEEADVRISLWSLVFRGDIVVREGSIRNLFVDATRIAPPPIYLPSGIGVRDRSDSAPPKEPAPFHRPSQPAPPTPPVVAPEREWLNDVMAELTGFRRRLHIGHLEGNGRATLGGGDRLTYAFVMDDFHPGGAGESVFELEVRSGPETELIYSATRIQGSARVHQKPGGGIGRIDAELSASFIGAEWTGDAVGWGDITVLVDAAETEAPVRFEAVWEISHLRGFTERLEGSARGAISGNGKVHAALPVRMTGAHGVSGVLFTGWVQSFSRPRRFAFEVDGDALYVEDLQSLFAVLGAAEPLLPPAAPRARFADPVPRDRRAPVPPPGAVAPPEPVGPAIHHSWEVPLWFGWEGSVNARIGEAVFTPHQARDLEAEVEVTAAAIRVPRLRFHLDGMPVEGSGDLAFDGTAERPYRLDGEIAIEAFDAGTFLRERDPTRAPFLEGLFSIRGSFSGDAVDPFGLVEVIQGELRMQSSRGSVRFISPGDTRIDTGMAIAGIAGHVLGGRNIVDAAGRFVREIQEIEFDHMEVHVVRASDLDVDLRHLAITNPDLALRGSGMIRYREDRTIAFQPLEAALRVAVSDGSPMARHLEQLRLLSADRNPDGLRLGPEFRVSGALSSYETNLMEIVSRAIARAMDNRR